MVAALLQGQQGAALYPVDDSARDPTFQAYVQRLRAAVAGRDVRALRRLMNTDDIVVGPEKEDKGWKKFEAKWRPGDSGGTRLWGALNDILAAGFVREHPRLFLSPYQVWRFPDNLDRSTHVVIARDKVVLRRHPSQNAAAVAVLSFDIVRRLGEPEKGEGLGSWVHVRTLSGREGYVPAREIVSPTAPRAQFGFEGGRWVMIALEDS